MKRFVYCVVTLFLLAGASACGENGITNPLPCDFGCPGEKDAEGNTVKGVLEGNTAISGVASVDAFFAAVNNFRGAADSVSASIDAQIDLIRGDFGIAANADFKTAFDAQVKANLDGGITVDYRPARCAVDAQATLDAKAKCEAKVDPGEVSVQCKGSCEIDANAELKCDAGADLQCTFTGPTVDCKGECTGSCEVKLAAAAECKGICRGKCNGTCSASTGSDMQATCAGECTGTCEGTCEAKLEAAAKCSGTCRGECKVTGAEADCKGSAHAECKAKADASIECKGKCEGEIKPPSASAECEATAKAEASINVQCSPPELAVNYKLKAGVDAMAQARFEAGLKNLARVRLPALVAATARAKVITKAGVDLGQSAEAAVLASVKTLQADGGLRTKITLACAMNELPDVAEAMSDSIDQLEDSLSASAAITGALGMK